MLDGAADHDREGGLKDANGNTVGAFTLTTED